MIGELVEVIVKIAEEINKDEQTLNSVNLEKRYNKNVVAAAYSWIYEKSVNDIFLVNEDVDSTLRILSKDEINIIGLENANYLMHFQNIGLINNLDLEYILDQLFILPEDYRNFHYINIFILSLFLDIDDSSLPGSRLLLNSSDTIN